MRKLLTGALCLTALLLLTLSAVAEPALTHGGYTAYLGESNYLYLQDPAGVTKVLRTPIGDILSLSDTHVYCIAQDGKLFGIRLDGQQTLILASEPTEEDIAKIAAAPVFDLTGTVLSLVQGDGTLTPVSATAVAACANDSALYFMESAAGNTAVLKSMQLGAANASAVVMGEALPAPISIIATDDELTIVHADRSITVVSLVDFSRTSFPATTIDVAKALSIDGTLLRYAVDEDGRYLYLAEDEDLSVPSLVNVTEEEPTQSPVPTATPKPTATPRPTATPKPTATAKPSSDSGYTQLDKGDSGSDVRKMQQRLNTLGYPVGKVDGVWGNDTQLAVNLFQCAIGYRERSYASVSMLEKLYSRNAPVYDPFAPLRPGDEGTDVLLMQTTLQLMGYNPGKLDGIYGANTSAAVSLLQAAAKLEVTGEATRETLEILFSPQCPVNPDTIPTTPPTEAPEEKPEEKPTTPPWFNKPDRPDRPDGKPDDRPSRPDKDHDRPSNPRPDKPATPTDL